MQDTQWDALLIFVTNIVSNITCIVRLVVRLYCIINIVSKL